MKPKALKWKTIHWNSGDVERAERGSMKRMKKAELLEKWSEYLHPDVRDWLISEIDSDLDELLRETAVKFHSECIGEPEAIKDPEIKKHYDILFEEWITSPNTGDKNKQP